jgi:uncharacterized sulfatase
MMKAIPLLIAASMPILSAAAAEPPANVRRVNVVHIISDDLNVDLGCYGHPIVKTPNLDRLAARGVRFDRAFCNYPVCNPSRTSFLSGKRPDSTKIVDNHTPTRTFMKDALMLPQLFRRNGWRTEKVGKIYHTGDAFEDPASWDLDIRETKESKNPPQTQILRKGKRGAVVLDADDADTWDGKVARKSVELLRKAARDGVPFYLAVGFRRPHTPYIAPRKYFDLYPPEKNPWPAEPTGHVADIPPIALTYTLGKPTLPAEDRAEVQSAYYASVSFMDAQVGVVLDALDRLKLWDSTVVLFHGDHGYHLGEHGGLHHKMTLFEEGTQTPLIIAAPGVKPGACRALVELVDLYPTLADLAGLTPPTGLEGISLRPLLNDPATPWKSAVFAVVGRHRGMVGKVDNTGYDINYLGRTVRTDRWRYTEWPDGSAELYDQTADPREYANLAKRPESAATVAALKQILKDGWKAVLPR